MHAQSQDDRWPRIEALFWAALERPAAEREAFLDAACDGDAQLREEVISLLVADAAAAPPDRAGDPLAGVVDRMAAALPEALEQTTWIGRRVGPYRILDRLGQGGMGTVYLAERDDVDKRVALKVVRGLLGAPDLVPRFLRERRVLARLEHPSIARLLDAGRTEDDTPWLALEYVDGEPITDWCRRRSADPAARLRLVLAVCDAVAYAHANLVVHRDLKPSNVLVTADGQVKLLDFGIAKLLDTGVPDRPADGRPTTEAGMRLLSPEYAAPEQVTGGAISTATDVYALGVLLFELVAGDRPYRVPASTSLESLHAMLEADPPRPSAVARRVGRPAREVRAVEGDLDAICLRALAREPARRYRSVDELARDITRHLEGRPVQARLPTAGYRARKFVRRHWRGVTAVALLTLSIAGGLGAALWQARRASAALAESEAVASFLGTIFEAANPNETLGHDVPVRDLLDRGARRADALAAQPRVHARMLQVVARAYRGLGEPATARQLAERALAEQRRVLDRNDPEIATTLATLAEALDNVGDTRGAVARYRDALAIRRRALGADAPPTLEAQVRLTRLLALNGGGEEAETLAIDALAARQRALPVDPEALARAEETLGIVRWYGRGDLAGADSLLRASLAVREAAFGPDDPRVERSLVPLGSVLSQREQHAEAEAVARRALALRTRLYGPDNLAVYYQLSNVAYVLNNAGRWAEADSLLRLVVARYERAYTGPHPQIAVALNGISTSFYRRRQLDSAEYYLRRSTEMVTQLYGPDHPEVALAWHNLGSLQRAQGRLPEAEASLRRAWRGRAAVFGDSSPMALRTGAVYADVVAQRGRADEADALLRRILRQQLALGVDRYSVATMGFLSRSLAQRGRFAEAESLETVALADARRVLAPGHAQRRSAASLLADILTMAGHADSAARLRAAESAREGKVAIGASR